MRLNYLWSSGEVDGGCMFVCIYLFIVQLKIKGGKEVLKTSEERNENIILVVNEDK